MKELMKDEIEDDVKKDARRVVEKTEMETRIKTSFKDTMSIEQIAKKSNVSSDVVNAVLEESGMLAVKQ
jgi:hypothetical protein